MNLNSFVISDFILRWVQVVGRFALLATVACYVWLAILQSNANAISRKTFMASQCVWVIFDGSPSLGIFQGGICPVTITLKNVSNSPALHFQAFVQYRDISNQWSDPVAMWRPIETEKVLLPQSPYWVNGNIVATATGADAAATAISNGQFLFRFIIRYTDPSQRNVETTQTYLTSGPQNAQQWVITESTTRYDGITQP